MENRTGREKVSMTWHMLSRACWRAVPKRILALLAGVGMLICAGTASAGSISLPTVNLGDTSFQDGIAFPGWLVEETLGYYYAGEINDHAGNQVPGSNKVTAVSATTHVAYLSKLRLLGGFYGAEVLLPLADADVDTTLGTNERKQGVGDLIIGPFILQWTDHKLFGMPYFHRFVLDLVLPTGEYDRNRAVNIGSNVVSLNPYYAFTIMPNERLELSARLHYLWNSENDKPFIGLKAGNVQPGQAFHANYAASYEVAKGVRVGMNGYVLQQLTANKVDGRSQANSEERVFGIGPGIQLSGGGLFLHLNSYFETGAENRPEGIKTVFRLTKAF